MGRAGLPGEASASSAPCCAPDRLAGHLGGLGQTDRGAGCRAPADRPSQPHLPVRLRHGLTWRGSMSSFDAFLIQRERASTAFVEGDVAPLLAVSVDTDPATIYPPTGAVVEGADAVNAGNRAGAAA